MTAEARPRSRQEDPVNRIREACGREIPLTQRPWTAPSPDTLLATRQAMPYSRLGAFAQSAGPIPQSPCQCAIESKSHVPAGKPAVRERLRRIDDCFGWGLRPTGEWGVNDERESI